MQRKSKKGFTLVEIMIVVVIIGLLAAMAIPAFQQIRENSVESTIDNDARQLASAAQQYFMDNPDITSVELTDLEGTFMTPLSDGVALTDASGNAATSVTLDTGFGLSHQHYDNGTAKVYTAEGRPD
jgi:type IV pilus assembly protein PilA